MREEKRWFEPHFYVPFTTFFRLLIGFVDDPSQPAWKGYFYATLMLLGACMQTLMLNIYLHMCFRMGMHVRGSVVAIVYRKALRLSSSAKRSSSMGEMVNLMSVDAQRFTDFMTLIHMLWSGPFQMGLAMYFLYDLLGWAVFSGLGTMLVVFLVNAFIIGKVKGFQVSFCSSDDRKFIWKLKMKTFANPLLVSLLYIELQWPFTSCLISSSCNRLIFIFMFLGLSLIFFFIKGL